MNNFTCLFCEAQLPSIDSFIKHLQSYPDSNTNRFKCVFENCMMIYSSGKKLKRHMEKHLSRGMIEKCFSSNCRVSLTQQVYVPNK